MRVVDLHHYRGPATYVGRAMPGRSGSPLGNPFKPLIGERPGTCLGKYREWLFERIRSNDPQVVGALREIDDRSVLACWCCDKEGEAIFADSEVCHAQVIFKAVRWMREQGAKPPLPVAGKLRCLSLWQPWATLLVTGHKRIETRGWPMRHRGPLLIHAAKHWTRDLSAMSTSEPFAAALRSLGVMWSDRSRPNIPFGAIIGRVEVIGCYPTERVDVDHQGRRDPPTVGLNRLLIDTTERAFGDYSPGRFALLTDKPVRFDQAVPYQGHQGLFDVEGF